ncbi:hypothetical protein [Pyramidobacter sp.]|uniref:hypothetical protein n=1 Tax=Pyramidobacter sp. TaxID=1943581 RepID=UPI00332A31B6
MNATFFDSSGRFTGTLSSTDEIGFALTVQERDYIDGLWDGERYYYDMTAGEAMLRPTMPVEQSGRVLRGLPLPCTVTVDGASYDVSDGIFEYESPLAGPHPVTVAAWPYLDWKGEIVIESHPSS